MLSKFKLHGIQKRQILLLSEILKHLKVSTAMSLKHYSVEYLKAENIL